jgi:hypothetical protein
VLAALQQDPGARLWISGHHLWADPDVRRLLFSSVVLN